MRHEEDFWDVEDYQKFLRTAPGAGHVLVELLQVKQGERILDIGCGDGLITEYIRLKGGDVIGVDSSPNMIKAAKERGLNAILMDAQNLTFENEFDAVFSHATLHWIKDTDETAKGIVKSLKNGGRFAAEFGVAGNIKAIESALIRALMNAGYEGESLNPWYHFEAEYYKRLFEQNGLEIEYMKLVPRMIPLPGGMQAWLKVFTGQFLSQIPASLHNAILQEAENIMRPDLCDAQGVWHADYLRLWIIAKKNIAV